MTASRVVGQARIRLPIEVMAQPDGTGFLAHIVGDWHHGDTEVDAVLAATDAVAHIATVRFTEDIQRVISERAQDRRDALRNELPGLPESPTEMREDAEQ